MIEGYATIKKIAEQWGITTRLVQVLCNKEKINGAVKLCRDWAVPRYAEKPEGGRVATGEYKNWRNK